MSDKEIAELVVKKLRDDDELFRKPGETRMAHRKRLAEIIRARHAGKPGVGEFFEYLLGGKTEEEFTARFVAAEAFFITATETDEESVDLMLMVMNAVKPLLVARRQMMSVEVNQ